MLDLILRRNAMLETVDDLHEIAARQRQIIALLESELGRWKQLAHDCTNGLAAVVDSHEAREQTQVTLNTEYLSAREMAHKHTG
jgi:adenylosuccinate lyase